MPAASTPGFLVIASLAVVAAGGATHRCGRAGTEHTWRSWAPAAAITLAAAPVAAATPLPVPSVLAAGGLAAAAVIDAVEGRIPTPIAYGSALLGAAATVVHILAAGDAATAASAYLWTAGLLAAFTVAWLLGGIGFGDVRLVPTLAPGLTGGLTGITALVYVTLILLAGLVLVRRRRRWDRPRVPLAPALFAGWLAALGVAAL